MRINHAIRASILISFSLSAGMAQTATSRIVSAANTFLSTLDQKQRQSVLFAFDDEQQRQRWSNFPISIVPRAGMSMGELNPAQRSAAMALVASALSQRGYEKVQQIMEGDEVLKTTDGGRGGQRPWGTAEWERPWRTAEWERTWRSSAGRRTRRRRRPVRQGSLLHLHPRHAFRKESLDVAVRRAPFGSQYHD